MKIFIRKAIADYAVAIWGTRNAAIRAQCAGFYPDSDLRTWTNGSPTDRFVQAVAAGWHVATVNNAVVGTGTLDQGTGHIDAIFVHPRRMRCGVGTTMMKYLERIAIGSGLTRLTLDSTLNAAAFYRTCGFTGEQIGEYKSPRGISLACIPMVKQLNNAVFP